LKVGKEVPITPIVPTGVERLIAGKKNVYDRPSRANINQRNEGGELEKKKTKHGGTCEDTLGVQKLDAGFNGTREGGIRKKAKKAALGFVLWAICRPSEERCWGV